MLNVLTVPYNEHQNANKKFSANGAFRDFKTVTFRLLN